MAETATPTAAGDDLPARMLRAIGDLYREEPNNLFSISKVVDRVRAWQHQRLSETWRLLREQRLVRLQLAADLRDRDPGDKNMSDDDIVKLTPDGTARYEALIRLAHTDATTWEYEFCEADPSEINRHAAEGWEPIGVASRVLLRRKRIGLDPISWTG
jgi:hypothetical protein